MKENSKLWYLKQLNLFKGITPEMAQLLEKSTEMEVLSRNDVVNQSFPVSQRVSFLKEGRLKVIQTVSSGEETIKSILYPGEILGVSSSQLDDNKNEMAVALDDEVKICSMDAAEFGRMMSTYPALALSVTASVGKKLQKLERKIDSLIFKDARTRIIEFLLELTEVIESGETASPVIAHNLTHLEMANLTATSRQTVTSVLNELSENNLISTSRGKIEYLDLSGLRKQIEH
jgi:CRP-like cAMP-binding protein